MDAVYICRPGEGNEELRYSLRSLAENFLDLEHVWIVGDWPSWVTSARKLAVPLQRTKHDTAEANLSAALQEPEISDPFLLMNDDFFILQPMAEIPPQHMGDLDQAIVDHLYGSAYRLAMQKTRDRLKLHVPSAQLYCYELHQPMVIDKAGMIRAIALGKGIHGAHIRTIYGNLMGLGGQGVEDCKVYRTSKARAYAHMPFLSTSDRTFTYHPAGRWIHTRFPERSPYEAIPVPGRRQKPVRIRSFVSYPQ